MAEKLETIEKCENCGATIGKLEKACVWKEAVVCAGCYARLNEAGKVEPTPLDYEVCPRCAAPLGSEFSFFNGKKFCRSCYSQIAYAQTQNATQRPQARSDQTTFNSPVAKVIFAILAIAAVIGLILFILSELGHKLIGPA
jgi:hypothetical protein